MTQTAALDFSILWLATEQGAERAAAYFAPRLPSASFDELLQEARVAAWEVSRRYEGKPLAELRVLALTTFRRRALDALRAQGHFLPLDEDYDAPAPELGPDWRREVALLLLASLESEEDAAVLEAVLFLADELTPKPQERTPVAALARALGRSRRAVQRSLERLRELAKERCLYYD